MISNQADKELIIVSGPTAVGKTKTCIDLALKYNAEIVSCDSRQFYKEMHIGTAKPTKEELKAVKHHFIGNVSIHEPYNVGIYYREAQECIKKLFKSSDKVIVTGGSGLYLKAITDGIDHIPSIEHEVKLIVDQLYRAKGLEGLVLMLKEKDPKAYSYIDLKNSRRVQRALEVALQTKKSILDFYNKKSFNVTYKQRKILLYRERESLYQRINLRVDQMIEQGLEQEALKLYPYKTLYALKTVGYTEFFDFFEQKYSSKKTAIEKIKQHTRNYAKRQLTWFKKYFSKEFINIDSIKSL